MHWDAGWWSDCDTSWLPCAQALTFWCLPLTFAASACCLVRMCRLNNSYHFAHILHAAVSCPPADTSSTGKMQAWTTAYSQKRWVIVKSGKYVICEGNLRTLHRHMLLHVLARHMFVRPCLFCLCFPFFVHIPQQGLILNFVAHGFWHCPATTFVIIVTRHVTTIRWCMHSHDSVML